MVHTFEDASEEIHQVVWPLGRSVSTFHHLKDRLIDLSGKTVGELWDKLFHGEHVFQEIRAELKKRYPDVRIVDYTNFEDIHGPNQREVIAGLPKVLEQYGCDAVIVGIGA